MKTAKSVGLLLGAGLAVLVGCNGGSHGDDGQTSTGAESGGDAAAEKQVDDQCFTAYAQAAGNCNKSAGDDDAAFTTCLTPVKAALVTCCEGGGSSSCAADASDSGDAQKQVDDACFANYGDDASKCNQSAGDDDAAFDACVAPVKAALVTCCQDGGSPACADDASH